LVSTVDQVGHLAPPLGLEVKADHPLDSDRLGVLAAQADLEALVAEVVVEVSPLLAGRADLELVQLEVLVDLLEVELLDPLRTLFPEFLVMTIPSMLRFPRQASSVMDRLMEVTMLTLKLIVKSSTSVPMMEKEV